ncbi:MAG: CBS domain-containing protein, partial [Alphaproteobacteria bacterium]|nr:CBS domain-containing protein [Alphaproteobacteria bacterium]
MTVQRILKQKGTYSPVVNPTIKIIDVVNKLEAEEMGALIVSTDGKKIDGIISERDVVLGIAQFGAKVLEKTVGDLMTKDVATYTAGDPVAGVMALMAEKRIRHVAVIGDGELAG